MLKDEVFYALEKHMGHVVSGGQLAKTLNVSRTAVWQAINALREEGNEITAVSNRGYTLIRTNDALSEKLIREGLTTSFVGRHMILLPVVNSTNQYLKEMDAAAAPDGYAAIADEQTGGRGRRNRVFLSAKGMGVYLSILLKLDGRRNDLRLLTIVAAVAVSRAIESVCGVRADIKWVNDIYCGGKKICGILTEAVITGESQELSTVIVGIGINTGSVPAGIADIATSVQEAAGITGVRNRLAAELLNQFETVYLDYVDKGDRQGIIRQYESRLFIIGQTIAVFETDHSYPATALGVDDTGALIVRDNDGIVRHISTGEIKINSGNDGGNDGVNDGTNDSGNDGEGRT